MSEPPGAVTPPAAPPRPFDARVWLLWGKADPERAERGGPGWHPLLCHVLDVVACADHLLGHVLQGRLERFAATLKLSPGDARPWLLFFVAIHDLGKATPTFQKKVPERRAALEAPEGLALDFPEQADEPHGNLSVPLATAALSALSVPGPLGRWVARAVGAHHGQFVSLDQLSNASEEEKGVLMKPHAGRKALWGELRAQLVQALTEVCGISAALPRPSAPENNVARNAFVADLAGLTTVADWLGSNADVFEYVAPPSSPADYLKKTAEERAARAVEQAGWRRPPVSSGRTFRQLFTDKEPWPLHEAVEALLPSIDGPSLLIVEAPMGEGKTEAALLLFDALAARGAAGLYFALPTQATSNQIFGRVERFLRSAFAGESHGLHLVHGDAGLSDAYDALKSRAFRLRSVGDVAKTSRDEGPIADAWFARGKRALLAPIAVGTIDQALLGVLGARHGFLRLHGLAGKVVVVDEVHAYDTYTSELLDQLLSWLHALGATVVLLSATLPASRREALVRSFGASSAPIAAYPRLTLASSARASACTFGARRAPMPVALAWRSEADLPAQIAEALAEGGCAVWIVNTVRRAQRLFSRLREMQEKKTFPKDVALDLLHARFPFAARSVREKRAEEAFGPGEERRPHAALLIGTQVLEQSLDLDFDLMVTEVAPVDLVLQRAGRLHRHRRENPRPAKVARPALWLLRPDDDERPEGPTFGSSAYVYDESVLLRSWLALRDCKGEITLPTDIEPLIEIVYGGRGAAPPADVASRLRILDDKHREETRQDKDKAYAVVLDAPASRDPFGHLARTKDEEDDPRIHPQLRTATRLGDPTVEIVPVLVRDGRTVLAGAPDVVLDLSRDEPLPRDVVIATARQALGIQRRDVVAALLREPVPKAFAASAHLRFHRAVRFDEERRSSVAGVPFLLDPDLGLVVGSLDDRRAATPETSHDQR